MAVMKKHAPVLLICIGLVLAVLAVYLPVIWFDFTNYDDPGYVLDNIAIQNGVTWPAIRWAFTHSHSANWHPVTWLSHMLDCQLYGLNPAGHHLTSIFFHTINTLLLFAMLYSLTGFQWRSACVAAIFALHPLHVESVAWIAERKDVLSAFFGLLSLWAYGLYARASKEEGHRKKTFYLLSLLCFAFGLMSKPMLVTWPFVLFLLDFWPLRRFQFGSHNSATQSVKSAASPVPRSSTNGLALLTEKIPFFVASIAICIITIISQSAAAAVAPLADAPFQPRILNALLAYFRYLEKLFWPTRLSVFYLDSENFPPVMLIFAALFLATITCLAWKFRRARPWFLAGWAWYLGTLVPVIGLIKVGNQSMADRYTYLPSIGLFIMVIWAAAERAARYLVRSSLLAAAMLSAFALIAQKQVMFWQNTETLFRHALALTENNYVALNSLAFCFADLGEFSEAQRFFQKSLSVHPNSPAAWNKLGSVLINHGRYHEALADCEIALRLNPRMPEAHTTFALACTKLGRTNDALIHYSEALQFQPDYAPAHYNLANTLVTLGRFTEARQHYQASLLSDPRSADARNNLAYLLARDRKLDEAIAQFTIALRFQPSFWQARYGLGETLARQNRFTEAAVQFAEVLRLKPDLALAHFQLALSLARQGKIADALASASQARLLAARNGQIDLEQKSRQLQEQLQKQ